MDCSALAFRLAVAMTHISSVFPFRSVDTRGEEENRRRSDVCSVARAKLRGASRLFEYLLESLLFFFVRKNGKGKKKKCIVSRKKFARVRRDAACCCRVRSTYVIVPSDTES
jgi:hypothetical protein